MNTTTPLGDLFPSKWLKAKDLTDAGTQSIQAAVTRVTVEEVQPRPQEKIERVCFHFAQWKPYLLTTKTDATTLAELYGYATPADAVGKPLTIKVDVFRGKAVLRIGPPPPARHSKPATSQTGTQPPVTPVSTTTPPSSPPPTTEPAQPQPPANNQLETATQPDAQPPVPPIPPAHIVHLKSGMVDWSTTFWQLTAALKVAQHTAHAIADAHKRNMLDATNTLWATYYHQLDA